MADIETRKLNGRWVNVLTPSYDTQEEAAAAGRAIARRLAVTQRLGIEWFLRARNGRWRLRNTYGRDPRRSKG